MLKKQWVIPPPPLKFELADVLLTNGFARPSHRHFVSLRNYLRDNGYVRYDIFGRSEYWIYEHTMSDKDRNKVLNNGDKSQIWTTESYALVNFGLKAPLSPLMEHRIERTLLDAGYRPRRAPGKPTYWSAKALRRQRTPIHLPKPDVPPRPRYPKGPFTKMDFLALNKMDRSLENLHWAQVHLKERCVSHRGRWVRPDASGQIPPWISGEWLAPGPAFTTNQFQVFNAAQRVSREEWRSALDWLTRNEFRYDPKAHRWVKRGHNNA